MAGLQSASRVVIAMEHLASNGSARLDDMAEVLEVHKSNALRLLTTLREYGWVVADETRSRYSIGPRMIAIGEAAIGGLELQKALALGEELRNLTGETVHVSILHGDRMLVVGRVDSHSALKVTCPVGYEDLLYASAVGKVRLAAMDDDELDEVIDRLDLVPVTSFTVSTPDELKEEIRATRARRFAINDEEARVGTTAMALALRFGGFNEPVSMSMTGPSLRFSREEIERIAPVVLEIVEPYQAL